MQGLRDAGYVYMNLDCGRSMNATACARSVRTDGVLLRSGWTTGKREPGPTGRLQIDTAKFPNMTDYSAQLHKLGMKFGMCEWVSHLGLPLG